MLRMKGEADLGSLKKEMALDRSGAVFVFHSTQFVMARFMRAIQFHSQQTGWPGHTGP
jgi:hypothetical protein